jgi:methionine-S-sulfoxide reductase
MKYLLALALLALVGCQTPKQEDSSSTADVSAAKDEPQQPAASQNGGASEITAADLAPAGMGLATFAGGCFWCMERPFESIEGVTAVYSGYTGGPEENPTYQQVGGGDTGHTEAVRVVYDPAKVSYALLLEVFWRNIKPTQVDGQFVDNGTQYRTGVFYHDEAQQKEALASKRELAATGKFDGPIVTEITKAAAFWPAEAYHQDFYITHPDHYQQYRSRSGRDQYLRKIWGDEAGGYSKHGASH